MMTEVRLVLILEFNDLKYEWEAIMGCDNMLFVITVTCMLHTVKKSSNCKFIVHSPFSSKHNSTNIKRLTAWDPSQTLVKPKASTAVPNETATKQKAALKCRVKRQLQNGTRYMTWRIFLPQNQGLQIKNNALMITWMWRFVRENLKSWTITRPLCTPINNNSPSYDCPFSLLEDSKFPVRKTCMCITSPGCWHDDPFFKNHALIAATATCKISSRSRKSRDVKLLLSEERTYEQRKW